MLVNRDGYGLYQGLNKSKDLPVLIKIGRKNVLLPQDIAAIYSQFSLLKGIDLKGVAKPTEIIRTDSEIALVMDYMEGEILSRLKELFSLSEVLQLGIELAAIIGKLHFISIIHKDISPDSILINKETKNAAIIDFNLASSISSEKRGLISANALEGNLSYISPEQTDRMNRAIDFRTDFYSLGVVLYELLTGQLPAKGDDAIEIVHSHISVVPPAPHIINPDIPQAVSEIVMKLLAKMAEDRYKSAEGIKADLGECHRQIQKSAQVVGFTVGRKDISDKFVIPQKLYGREIEINFLLESFREITEGVTAVLLISGSSGTGKTSVVYELHKQLTEKKVYFISGKFEQFHVNVPFSALVKAFRDLVRYTLKEPDTELENLKQQIIAALGSNARIITDVIPELEIIIGR